MKLIKPLIFTLFLTPALTVIAAEDTAVENTEPSSGAIETSEIKRALPDPALQRQTDLAKEQDTETEVIWLKLDNQKLLALLQKAANASPVGNILIFSDRDSGADGASMVHPIRTQMTEFGWNTLSLSLPEPPARIIPVRTLPVLQERSQIQTSNTGADINTEITPESSDEDSALTRETTSKNQPKKVSSAEYNQEISKLGQLASEQLINLEGKLTVIIGIGEGATWALHYFTEDENREDRFLVLLDPVQPSDKSAPNLMDMITTIKVPILDLWFNSNKYKQQQAELRKRTARRSGNRGYQQIRLNQRSNDPRREPLWLTRQLRGIFKTRIIENQTKESSEQPKAQPIELSPGG